MCVSKRFTIAMIITPVHRWKDAFEKYLLQLQYYLTTKLT